MMAKRLPYCQTRVSARRQLQNTGRDGAAADAGVLVLDERDTVAVATRGLLAGEMLEVGGTSVEVREAIPFGHKVALTDMPRGAPVTKYGEMIGIATADIERGAHVHVHNVVSARLPGPGS
jgi:altronate dehydratase